jgi:poly(A) polymerase
MNMMKASAHQGTENSDPAILTRSRHPISRKDIDPDALKVLYRLYRNGFKAYLVGGAVRDLLIGKKPKDFDVVTDAHPGQVKKLFGNCLLIGRRFRLAHIRFKGGKIIEVATFRKEPEGESETSPDQNNSFGTPLEDAFRRDITINALFYDISDFSIIDYVGGLGDMEKHRVCMIGNPHERYVEDPVRIWRVLRHAARLDFTIEEETARAIEHDRELLCTCSGARLFEELNKDLTSGLTCPVFKMLHEYGILPILFGKAGKALQDDPGAWNTFVHNLSVVDSFINAGKKFPYEGILALLFWPWAEKVLKDETREGMDILNILHSELLGTEMAVTIPKTLKAGITQIIYIAWRMFSAMRTGRMRWSLKKRARYLDASVVFSLLYKGEVIDAKDPFGRIFKDLCPSAPSTRKRRRPHRRRNGQKTKGSEHNG